MIIHSWLKSSKLKTIWILDLEHECTSFASPFQFFPLLAAARYISYQISYSHSSLTYGYCTSLVKSVRYFSNIQRQKCISTQLYFYILYLVKSGLSDRSVLILSRPHPTVQNPPSCHTFLRAWKSDHGRSRTAGPSFVTLKLQLPVATDGCRHCFLKSKSASREKSSKLGGTLANLPSERHRWHTSILKKTIQIWLRQVSDWVVTWNWNSEIL